ncbi:MAG: pyridoxamine 5'-phosphate oxidase family protein [Flavobacteriaceae bacterium]|nr:pyridoxamine 5'-phosphate oxidase family protein [Flavobacteriaceae bacterium]MDG2503490.1 pyridoxamine 5'-phosphate oxidase family protein [Flavobacteriaceae bacterium]
MEIKDLMEAFDSIVLCWLATVSSEGEHNVSPKELFFVLDTETLLIANSASPQRLKNILQNSKVCVSGVNVFTQKEIQCKGTETIIDPKDCDFKVYEKAFQPLIKGKFRIQNIIRIKVKQTKKIIAPSYFFYPNTDKKEQIKQAKRPYLNYDDNED